ncbi:hypothetical protein [Catellatospora tritici]|uniref:hypothetical protein n=1 Tax=Catellatospora tritici TaxID=2851566 RepID=UPI001C2DD19C|nr:hypothetical protein [Catellatospora tritici]MBV1854450.1 hypothetical protein [Catellatospora tritici]
MRRLLLVTGLRRGELAGIKWEDFGSATGTVRVVRQQVVEGDDSVVREKRPKPPNSVGTIMLDKVTAETLGRMRPAGGVSSIAAALDCGLRRAIQELDSARPATLSGPYLS